MMIMTIHTCREWIVEYDDIRTKIECSGNVHVLFLPPTQVDPPLTNLCCKSISHPFELYHRVTSVMSLSGKNCRSGNRHANLIARQYLSSSKACPNNTFSLYTNSSILSPKIMSMCLPVLHSGSMPSVNNTLLSHPV